MTGAPRLGRRIVCVWMPRFRLAVEAREQAAGPGMEGLGGLPPAIFRPSGHARELVECPPELEAEGMRPGMPLKEAELRWPGVLYRPDDPPRYARAFEPVLAVLDAFSPIVEADPSDGPGVAFLDGTGLEPLYGPEEQLGQRIARDVAELTGYDAQVGIAGGKLAARLAAACPVPIGGAVSVVPPGGDAVFLGPLPIGAAPLPAEARERVTRLGLGTLGELARLPANAVRHRFGPEGVRARMLASGRDDEPLRPRPAPLRVRDEIEFEWVETDLDRLTFALKRLADRLSARLLGRGLGCGRLGVTWRLEGGATRDATVHLAERSATGGRLLEHLRWHVEGLRLDAPGDDPSLPAGGVRGIAVEAQELAPSAGRQLKLLPGEDGRAPRPERLLKAGDVLARLRARWGDAAVRQAEPVESRRPEAQFRWRDVDLNPPSPALRPGRKRPSPVAGDGRTWENVRVAGRPRPLRVMRSAPLWLSAEPEDVEVRRGGVGPDGRRQTPLLKRGGRGGRGRRIVRAAGPWRLVEPWAAEPIARDSYHVVTTDGEACWLVYDQLGDRWLLLGVFD